MANQGPKLGEAGHFLRLGDKQGDQSYAVRRFTDEANRLYGVLNNRLYDRRYLAGDDYTIADMICYPWTVELEGAAAGHRRVQIFQALVRGAERPSRRPARPRGHRRPQRGPRHPVAGRARASRQAPLQPARPACAGGIAEDGAGDAPRSRVERLVVSKCVPSPQSCHPPAAGAVSAPVRLSSSKGGAE